MRHTLLCTFPECYRLAIPSSKMQSWIWMCDWNFLAYCYCMHLCPLKCHFHLRQCIFISFEFNFRVCDFLLILFDACSVSVILDIWYIKGTGEYRHHVRAGYRIMTFSSVGIWSSHEFLGDCLWKLRGCHGDYLVATRGIIVAMRKLGTLKVIVICLRHVTIAFSVPSSHRAGDRLAANEMHGMLS